MSFWKSPTWGSMRFSSSSCLTLASSCLTQDKVDSKIKKKELTLYTQVLFSALSGYFWFNLFKSGSDNVVCYLKKKKGFLPRKPVTKAIETTSTLNNCTMLRIIKGIYGGLGCRLSSTMQPSCSPQNVKHLEDTYSLFYLFWAF